MRFFRAIFTAISLLAAVTTGYGDGWAAPKGGSSKGRLSANQFIALNPFVIPMMPVGDERRQFTLAVALELADEDERDYVRSRMPVIRSRVYDMLFRLIAYRTQEPLVPSTGLIKKKIFEIAQTAVGPDKIASVVVQQVYQGRAP